jgi:hypothetical protein
VQGDWMRATKSVNDALVQLLRNAPVASVGQPAGSGHVRDCGGGLALRADLKNASEQELLTFAGVRARANCLRRVPTFLGFVRGKCASRMHAACTWPITQLLATLTPQFSAGDNAEAASLLKADDLWVTGGGKGGGGRSLHTDAVSGLLQAHYGPLQVRQSCGDTCAHRVCMWQSYLCSPARPCTSVKLHKDHRLSGQDDCFVQAANTFLGKLLEGEGRSQSACMSLQASTRLRSKTEMSACRLRGVRNP